MPEMPEMPEPTLSWDGQQAARLLAPEAVAGCDVLLLHGMAPAELSAGQSRSSASKCLGPALSLAAEVEAALAVAEPASMPAGTPAGSVSAVHRQRGSSSDAAALPAGEVHLSEAAAMLAGREGPSAPGLRRRQAHEEAPS